jgi:hypothetical protein
MVDNAGGPPLRTSSGAGLGLAADLARAMQAAAQEQRGRISSRLAERVRTYTQAAQERAAAEARQLLREAEADIEDIYERSQAQITQLRREAGLRVDQRRDRLSTVLDRHASILDAERERINAAIQAHEAVLDGFFRRLAAESDPVAIAGLAGSLPAPPDIDAIGARARADALSRLLRGDPTTDDATDQPVGPASADEGPDVVGVMDPESVNRAESGVQHLR